MSLEGGFDEVELEFEQVAVEGCEEDEGEEGDEVLGDGLNVPPVPDDFAFVGGEGGEGHAH